MHPAGGGAGGASGPHLLELVVPLQPASSFESSAFARPLPFLRAICSIAPWLAQAQLGSSLELELSLGLALCLMEPLRGHGCFSMVTIEITLYRVHGSLQRSFDSEFRLFISSCLLKETLGRERVLLPGLFCRWLGL